MQLPAGKRPRGHSLAVAVLGAVLGCSGQITIDVGDDDDDDSAPRADADVVPGAPDAAIEPGIDAAAPAPPDATPDYLALTVDEQALFDTINEERVAAGKIAVQLRADLNCAAKRHSDDIGDIGACTHTGSDGSSPGDRVAGCSGSGWSGEIVACGQGTPRSAVDAWIGSPGHNAIMFDGGQRFIGVAMHNNYWTAIFDR